MVNTVFICNTGENNFDFEHEHGSLDQGSQQSNKKKKNFHTNFCHETVDFFC